MARSKTIGSRSIDADTKFNSRTVAKLINRSMRDGKKSTAAHQVYRALELAATQTGQPALEVLEIALKNITPQMEVRSRRVGGAAYQVPMPVRPARAFSLAIRWLVNEANKRSNQEFHTYADKLAAELLDAVNSTGGAVQKKITSHKMAEANKAFAHFRW